MTAGVLMIHLLRILFAALAMLVVIPSTGLAANRKPPSTAASTLLAEFQTEAATQQHCPRDEVVWLNTNSGIYHEKGMRWYGRTKYGAYVCRKEADAAGDRDTRNGQ
ncbi:MAG: hypothetical protein JWO85_1217 [Candidatus Eremiobacteraeota bacterium]|nr:hypothetical protein [Candidatus Eremiobacteraeota bacterium]